MRCVSMASSQELSETELPVLGRSFPALHRCLFCPRATLWRLVLGGPFHGDREVARQAGFGDDGASLGVESEAELDGEFLGGKALEGADDGVGGGAHGGEWVVEPFVELGDDVLSAAADLLRAPWIRR